MKCEFRFAEEADTGIVLDFIKQFDKFRRTEDKVTATEEKLHKWLFEKRVAEVLFCVVDGKEVGFALFNQGFSGSQALPCIYVENFYFLPGYRGMGLGTKMFVKLAQITEERGWARISCSSPDWNGQSAHFFNQLGAEEMNGWTVYRFEGESLHDLAARKLED